jgi:ATP-dependent DNA helicase PIF1
MFNKYKHHAQKKWKDPSHVEGQRSFPDLPLSADQIEAAKLIDEGVGPFFLTGPAGCGKSFLIEHLRKRRRVSVCATTGIAAQLIRGRTVHSFCGIHPNLGVFESYTANQRVKNTDILVIDEVSMASSELLTQIVQRFEVAEHWPKIVTVGDLLQLPPVSGGYVYENPMWETFKVIRLTTIHRQQDRSFVDALNDLRVGNVSQRVTELVEERRVEALPTDCTQLYPHRATVEDTNLARLASLEGEEKRFEWDVIRWKKHKDPQKDAEAFEKMSSKARFPRMLSIKIGARVCMLNNEQNGAWVNGSTGKIVSMEFSRIDVDLDNGRRIEVYPMEEQVYAADEDPSLVVKQYPMMLAWALTAHKSQGMTLDRVGIDLSNHFAPGMTYVALSRCKTKEGLHLIGKMSPIKVDARALAICV